MDRACQNADGHAEAQQDVGAAYDAYAEVYERLLQSGGIVIKYAARSVAEMASPLDGATVLDLGCGQGLLTRMLAERGGRVTGVDISSKMLEIAESYEKENPLGVVYVRDDARSLSSFAPLQFDVVTSSMALMDIAELEEVFQAVHRVLRPGGRFVFAVTHPCFLPPHAETEADENGRFLARKLRQYTREGFWRADGTDRIRAALGAYHRTLSTYINQLIDAGFEIRRLKEPTLYPLDYPQAVVQSFVELPPLLVVGAEKR